MNDETTTTTLLAGRACPSCGDTGLRWAKKSSKKPHSKVVCRNGASCSWAGPYFESIPRREKRGRSKAKLIRPVDKFVRAMQESFNSMLDGDRALDKFEDHLLNDPHGDPDTEGSDLVRSYVRRLAQLRFLIQLMDIIGIKDEEHRKHIVSNEIDRMFHVPGSGPA